GPYAPIWTACARSWRGRRPGPPPAFDMGEQIRLGQGTRPVQDDMHAVVLARIGPAMPPRVVDFPDFARRHVEGLTAYHEAHIRIGDDRDVDAMRVSQR